MKADVQYNDFVGTAAADISDFLGLTYGNDLNSFGEYFKIDGTRFKVIGISIRGNVNFSLSILCIDKIKSSLEKEHIVKMSMNIENNKEILRLLFKRLNIVLHSKYDNKYSNINFDEEVNYEDFSKTKNEE